MQNWAQLENIKTSDRVYLVTPTIKRPAQLADLIRLAQAIYPVRKFVTWLIFEDYAKTNTEYPGHVKFLKKNLKDFANICLDINIDWSRLQSSNIKAKFNPKGVEGRLDGLIRVREDCRSRPGVLFFADDDNTYDSDIFRQILSTDQISVWSVGLTTQLRLSAPVVNEHKVVVDVYDGFKVNRRFPFDFAGFAVNTNLILKNPTITMSYIAGYEETMFLRSLRVKMEQFKPLGNWVLTYHTRTVSVSSNSETAVSPGPFPNDAPPYSMADTNIMHLFKEYSPIGRQLVT